MKPVSYLALAVALGVAVAPALKGANPPKKTPADSKAADAKGADAKKPAPAAAEEKPATPSAAPAGPALPDTFAVVEGAPIKKDEVENRFAMMLSSQGIPAEAVPEAQKVIVYHKILDQLIVEKLIDKRAAGEKVTDEEVATTFDRFKKNFGSEEEMAKQVAEHGQTLDQIKTDIKASLREQHWVDSQIKDKVDVSDAEAADYYKSNPDKFTHGEQVRASHILVSVPQDAKPEVVAEKQKQAQEIADRVKKGEDFGKLAEQLSEDPSAKENKGDLNFFDKEQMVPEFSTAAFAMKKDEISNPVRSQFGFHVIKVTDRKAAETTPLDQAKPQLLAMLKRQKQQSEFKKLVDGIREKADVKVNLPSEEAPSEKPAPAEAAPAAAPAPAPAEKK